MATPPLPLKLPMLAWLPVLELKAEPTWTIVVEGLGELPVGQ